MMYDAARGPEQQGKRTQTKASGTVSYNEPVLFQVDYRRHFARVKGSSKQGSKSSQCHTKESTKARDVVLNSLSYCFSYITRKKKRWRERGKEGKGMGSKQENSAGLG